jgi:general secretion pathway protein K
MTVRTAGMSEKQILLQNEQGMALLITVMTVSLLVAVTLQYHKATWQQFLVSHNYRVGNQLGAIADSGVNIALALLEHDGEENEFDSFFDSWATFDQESFSGLFPSGSLRLQVVDLSGRLQINSLVRGSSEVPGTGGDTTENEIREILLRLLLSGDFVVEDETEARTIIDALVDWIDADDQELDLGAESSFYQSLEKSYSCRNGPVRYMEELLLVKGISPALLFGSEGKKGLASYLTVHGDDGKVNLGTAPLLLIKSMDTLINDDLLKKLDEYRRAKENEESLAGSTWYKGIDGWPGDIVINETLLTSTSSYFQIIATGALDGLSRRVVAIAERPGGGEVNLLGKKME